MNIRDLEYIVAVAEQKSFSKAATKCNVSQPTLSVQLKKLEEQLGAVIFERSNRIVNVTEVGRKIVEISRRMLQDRETIFRVAQDSMDPLGGKIHLCAIPTLSSYMFPRLVKVVRNELPQTKLVLSEEKTDGLVDKLVGGQIDIGLVALPVNEPAICSLKLFDDPFLLAAPRDHELAQKNSVDFKTIRKWPLLLLEDGHCLGDQALELCAENGVNIEDDLRATSLETLKQMVIAGTGLTLVPRLAATEDQLGIKYIPFSRQNNPGRAVGLIWRKTMPRVLLLEKMCSLIKSINFNCN